VKNLTMKHLVIFLFFFSVMFAQAQDTLIMLNGRIHNVDIIYLKDDVLKYETTKKGKTIQQEIDKNRVYAIIHKDGREELIYHQDSVIGFDYTPEDMLKFIYGERDAMATYNGFAKHFLINFVISGAAGYVMGNMLAIPVPFLVTVGGIMVPNKISSKVKYKKFVKDEPYQNGYFRVVKGKKVQHLLLGGALGVATGLVLSNVNL
jgi:hypothetical protein